MPTMTWTLRCAMRSGTAIHETLNHDSALNCSSLSHGTHARSLSSRPSLCFSRSDTGVQSSFKVDRNAARSPASSVSNRCRKSAVSARIKRARNSGERENARRSTQCPISSCRLSSSRLAMRAVFELSGRCCFVYVAIALDICAGGRLRWDRVSMCDRTRRRASAHVSNSSSVISSDGGRS